MNMKKSMLLVLVATVSFAGISSAMKNVKTAKEAGINQMADRTYWNKRDTVSRLIAVYEKSNDKAQKAALEKEITGMITDLNRMNQEPKRQRAIKKLDLRLMAARQKNTDSSETKSQRSAAAMSPKEALLKELDQKVTDIEGLLDAAEGSSDVSDKQEIVININDAMREYSNRLNSALAELDMTADQFFKGAERIQRRDAKSTARLQALEASLQQTGGVNVVTVPAASASSDYKASAEVYPNTPPPAYDE